VYSVDDAATAGRHRAWIITAAVLVVVVVALVALLLPTGTNRDAKAVPGSASLALARLDANDGESYVGSIGDATSPVKLRRVLRAEFRSGDARPSQHGSKTRAQRCATQIRGTTDARRGRLVLLADATVSAKPVVVIGITDHGRVVAFVADADTCEVRMAQSL
jgi:hypothetical protein